MKWRNSERGYGALTIGLHWLMFALLLAVVALMELRGMFPKGSASRETMKALHYMFGMLVLALVLLRIGVRLAGTVPAITPVPPRWQARMASLVALALYGLMLGMPLVGWLMLNAGGEPAPFFGLHLPSLTGPDKALAKWLEDVHEAGATIAYFLVGLHVLAALFHHYVMRDDTLKRMLPHTGSKTAPNLDD